jgi:lysophospholipase L1-like esterase
VNDRGARVSDARHDARARQVLFLGDSVTNGGTAVGNDETISALVEDEHTASANFATMLYGVDQMYLALRDQLREARPSVVVVGLTETGIEGLGNRYVPLRRRTEANMPFLKPRFLLQDGKLRLLALPPVAAYDDLLGEASLLTELATTDDYYQNFSAYRRSGFLPVSGMAWAAWSKAAGFLAAWGGVTPYSDVLAALMREIVEEGRRRGASTVFVLNATAVQTRPPRWRQAFPDRYGRLLRQLRSSGFVVLDARDALLKSGRPLGELYSADGIHYRVEGNRAIAAALRPLLRENGF